MATLSTKASNDRVKVFNLERNPSRRSFVGLPTLRFPLPNRATESAVMEVTRLVLNHDGEFSARRKSKSDVEEWDAQRRTTLRILIDEIRKQVAADAVRIDAREAILFDPGSATGARADLDAEIRESARTKDAQGLARLFDAASRPEHRDVLVALARHPDPTSTTGERANTLFRGIIKAERADDLKQIAIDREGTIDWAGGTLNLMQNLIAE